MEIKEYIRILKRRLWLIIGCVLIATITAAIYSRLYIPPVYQATTKLIVNKTVEQEQFGREQMDLGAIGINIRLIDTYKEIIRTPAILEKVVQRHPELNLTPDYLSRVINVQSLNQTQVMTLTAVDYSYERAMQIVNAVSLVFQTEIPKIMKVDNVTVLNMAQMTDNPTPINQKSSQYIMISFAISLLFAIGISFLLEFLDDTIKTEEDIEQVLGLPTLTTVIKAGNEPKTTRSKPNRRKTGEAAYAAGKQ
jgi:capsular polysaccharide biosynthesis protein